MIRCKADRMRQIAAPFSLLWVSEVAHKGTVAPVAVWNTVAPCSPLWHACYIHSLYIQHNYKTVLLIDRVIAYAFDKPQ
jgi:hypothetical protein